MACISGQIMFMSPKERATKSIAYWSEVGKKVDN
jgi:hypothetical protein